MALLVLLLLALLTACCKLSMRVCWKCSLALRPDLEGRQAGPELTWQNCMPSKMNRYVKEYSSFDGEQKAPPVSHTSLCTESSFLRNINSVGWCVRHVGHTKPNKASCSRAVDIDIVGPASSHKTSEIARCWDRNIPRDSKSWRIKQKNVAKVCGGGSIYHPAADGMMRVFRDSYGSPMTPRPSGGALRQLLLPH